MLFPKPHGRANIISDDNNLSLNMINGRARETQCERLAAQFH